jgi:hypothetical protein
MKEESKMTNFAEEFGKNLKTIFGKIKDKSKRAVREIAEIFLQDTQDRIKEMAKKFPDDEENNCKKRLLEIADKLYIVEIDESDNFHCYIACDDPDIYTFLNGNRRIHSMNLFGDPFEHEYYQMMLKEKIKKYAKLN